MNTSFISISSSKYKQVFLVIILALIPFCTFGHVRAHFNWLTGFVWYSMMYLGLGLFQHRTQIKQVVYHSIALAPLFYLPFYLYTISSDFFYPAIIPFTILAGGTAYLGGYLFYYKKVVGKLLLAFSILLDIYWCLELLPRLLPKIYEFSNIIIPTDYLLSLESSSRYFSFT